VELRYDHAGAELLVTASRTGAGFDVSLPSGAAYAVGAVTVADDLVTLTVRGRLPDGTPGPERVLRVPCVRSGSAVSCAWAGRVYRFTPAVPGRPTDVARGADGQVTAPTSGVVLEVMVAEGQAVEAYQRIAVIEAMKVMTPVDAPFAGRVIKLMVGQGQRIEQGSPVAHVEAIEQSVGDSS
jgi:biotin carboxyl carrier protein